jgi:hypothetical protein
MEEDQHHQNADPHHRFDVRARGVAAEKQREAADQQQRDRGENPGKKAREDTQPQGEPAGGSSGPLAGRNTSSAKNMPPTQTMALSSCRMTATVGTSIAQLP